MLIFKRLQKAVNSVTKNILQYKYDDQQVEKELNKLSALKEIISYVKRYQWLSHTKSREKIKAFLRNNYSYRKTCEELNISLHSLEQSVSYAAKTLQSKIGGNTIDLILSGDTDAAMLQFRVGTNTLNISKLFSKDIMELLPEPHRDNILKLEECTEELKLLRKLSKFYLQKVINSKDKDKLAFILYLMVSNDAKYTFERDLAYRYIAGSAGDAELIFQSNKNIFAGD